ncbi:MAG TPA: phosphodiester glycosidase family protein [Trichocoleus sp.]
MMLRQRQILRLLLGLGLGLALALLVGALAAPQLRFSHPLTANAVPQEPLTLEAHEKIPGPPPDYRTIELPQSVVHVVTVADPQTYPVRVSLPEDLVPLEAMAQRLNAQTALNAGFFDPNNGLTTSHVVVGGELAADPRQNPRLMGNPDLTAYLDQILNRSEFRRYDCAGVARYDITLHSASVPAGCQLVDAVGAGPQLLPQDSSYEEAFIDYDASGSINRDALGSRSRNARSAVGIKPNGSVVLVMTAQRPGISPSGMSFADMVELLQGLGVEKALNLDGGSSSSLVYQGTTYYGRLDRDGNWVQRPVKAILWIANQRLAGQ